MYNKTRSGVKYKKCNLRIEVESAVFSNEKVLSGQLNIWNRLFFLFPPSRESSYVYNHLAALRIKCCLFITTFSFGFNSFRRVCMLVLSHLVYWMNFCAITNSVSVFSIGPDFYGLQAEIIVSKIQKKTCNFFFFSEKCIDSWHVKLVSCFISKACV